MENIKQQFLSIQLKKLIEKLPHYLSYNIGDTFQIVKMEKIHKNDPDFVAKVTYLTTKEGGRTGYAAPGYRPHIKFDGRKELTSGEQSFVDKEKVFPGDTAIAEIRIVSPNLFNNHLFVGQHFEFGEGPRIVGHGEIIEIINPSLRQPSR